jgi:hypothetical protein
MQKLTLTLFLALLPFFLFSQDTIVTKNWGYKGYSGGMFIHTGYVQSKPFLVFVQCNEVIEQQIKGAVFGLGGKMSIYFNRYFRVGGEGYFSSCRYGTYKNSNRIGWGGITFDMLYPVKKWAPFAGITFGYGSATNLIFTERQQNTQSAAPVVYFKNSFFLLNPAIGVEFFTTNRISLLFKIDYLLNISKKDLYYPHGVRFYLGVHFYQKK